MAGTDPHAHKPLLSLLPLNENRKDPHAHKIKIGTSTPPPCIWAKRGRFVILPVLCLLAFGNTTFES